MWYNITKQHLHLTIRSKHNVVQGHFGKSVKTKFLITVKEIGNVAEQQVFFVIPHEAAAGTKS